MNHLSQVNQIIQSADSVLDLGTYTGGLFKQLFSATRFKCGIDIYLPFVKLAKELSPDAIFVVGDMRNIGHLFHQKSFDIVTSNESLEHVFKDEALKVLEAAEEIARKLVYIRVPYGNCFYDVDIQYLGGRKYQNHKSFWRQEDFRELGYVTHKEGNDIWATKIL